MRFFLPSHTGVSSVDQASQEASGTGLRLLLPTSDDGIRRAGAYYRGIARYWAEEMEVDFRYAFASLSQREAERVSGSGYVVDTLLAALWCLCATDSYESCVLRAVNMGNDSDTVAAVAGGLAGIHYGYDAIPNTWRDQLIRRGQIEEMCDSFCQALTPRSRSSERKSSLVPARHRILRGDKIHIGDENMS